MKYQGIIKKSRTFDFGALVLTLGVIEANLPLVKDQIGDWYGWILMGIGVAIIWLRKLTKGPVGDK
jgi:hypothetical protein